MPTTGNLANLKNEKQCGELRELASKESDQHKLGRILKKFSGCRKSDRRSLNRAQAIASQDKRKLLSEARAVPPLMSGTIINSSTVAWHTTVTSHKKSVSLKNNERMMELFEFGSTRF